MPDDAMNEERLQLPYVAPGDSEIVVPACLTRKDLIQLAWCLKLEIEEDAKQGERVYGTLS